jgi:NADP-dependent 3-hydroxy acid dehydrogenase YdfG
VNVTQITLSNHAAVVAGATSDIGRAVCSSLAAAGARLCLLGRDRDALDLLAKELHEVTDEVFVYPIDLTVDACVTALATQLARDVGGVDVLVLSAGVFEMGSHADAAIAALDHQYQTNVRGPYLLTQALLPLLCSRRGQIVFVNSTVGLEARASVGQYASTQHALRAIADALRAEINGNGVRVLTLYLGRTATARQARIFEREGRAYAPELLIQPDDVAEMVLAALRLPRTAEVTEIRMRPLVKSY